MKVKAELADYVGLIIVVLVFVVEFLFVRPL